MKIVYNYDAETRRFLSTSVADPDPMVQETIEERVKRVVERDANNEAIALAAERGQEVVLPFPEALDPEELPMLEPVYLLPAFSTTIAPPPKESVPEGHWPIFLDDAWAVIELPKSELPGADPDAPADDFEVIEEEAPTDSAQRHVAWAKKVMQNELDLVARSKGYDDMFSAVSYAEEDAVPQFQIEGKAMRRWRSLFWAAGYQVLGAVQAGEAEAPLSRAALIALLPTFEESAAPEEV
jgi:hypothetical protein